MSVETDIEKLKLVETFWNLSGHPKLDISWLEKYPLEKWDWLEISSHPNLQLEWLIKKQVKFRWYWKSISKNPNFKLEWVENKPNLCWDWEVILETQNLENPKWLELYPTRMWKDEYWLGVSKNKNLTTEFVYKYLTKPWSWKMVVQCPNFEFEWLDKYIQEVKKNIKDKIRVFELLSSNPKLDIDWINKYPNYKWDFNKVKKNPNFKIEWVNKNPDYIWSMTELSRHPKTTLDFIYTHMELEWDWGKYGVSRNPNFRQDWFIVFHNKRKHMHWGSGGLSSHHNFNAEWIINNHKKDWSMCDIKKNNIEEYNKIIKMGYTRRDGYNRKKWL
jgi:hypothetical protein